MHHGIYVCDAEAPLVEVAAVMSARRTHCVMVLFGQDMGAISDVDVLAAISRDPNLRARDVAGTETLTASSDASLLQTAQVMAEHNVSHVVVVDHADGHPVGVLSSTDIISAFAAEGGYGTSG